MASVLERGAECIKQGIVLEILLAKPQVEDVKETEDKAGEGRGAGLERYFQGFDADCALPDDGLVPVTLQYEKSFLRKIPSIILEAHESIISQKNEEAPTKKGMTQEDLTDFINQVHQESAQSAQSCNSAEEAYSSQNTTSQRQTTKKNRSHPQHKFFEKSACFDVPSAQDAPVDLFD